ncbi:hypothetical protein FIBSPDRAFT_1051466 [Athelia psychrophila]|uniref:Uncharacterized protein n=1 Tax=Athelia psychrophila TaxID=1759441 RepID=A0A165Z2C0_9AGAM|nr:hypothetical protein FIBSPDRAFT_1051466 [Fibularhizoctonia sp. CBS 109695]
MVEERNGASELHRDADAAAAYPSAVTADPQTVRAPTAPSGSHSRLCSNFLALPAPSPGPAPEAQLPSQPPSRPLTQPQSPASRSHPRSPQVPGSIHRHMQQGQERVLLPLFYPGGPNGAASTGSGDSSPSASPIIGVGGGIEGGGFPLGNRGPGVGGRAPTAPATQLDQHDVEGNGNSNAVRNVSKGNDEEDTQKGDPPGWIVAPVEPIGQWDRRDGVGREWKEKEESGTERGETPRYEAMPVLPFDEDVPLQIALDLFITAPQDRTAASTTPGTTPPRIRDLEQRQVAVLKVVGCKGNERLWEWREDEYPGPPDAILLVLATSAEPLDGANFTPAVPHSISTFTAANSALEARIVHHVVHIRPGHPLPIVLLYRQH